MNDIERLRLMREKAALNAELLELTKNIGRVREILRKIETIDRKLGV